MRCEGFFKGEKECRRYILRKLKKIEERFNFIKFEWGKNTIERELNNVWIENTTIHVNHSSNTIFFRGQVIKVKNNGLNFGLRRKTMAD